MFLCVSLWTPVTYHCSYNTRVNKKTVAEFSWKVKALFYGGHRFPDSKERGRGSVTLYGSRKCPLSEGAARLLGGNGSAALQHRLVKGDTVMSVCVCV